MIQTKSDLENFIVQEWDQINAYLDELQKELPMPIYTSVDIRESKDKFAPVDNNFYPAGFNNLCLMDLREAAPHFKKFIQKISPDIKNIGIIAESNTRNLFYLDHLAMLKKCLTDAGFNTYIISFDLSLFAEKNSLELTSQSGFDITLYAAAVKDHVIKIQDADESITLCLSLMNNDQSAPLDIDWSNLQSKIEPSPQMGWHKRTKVQHFQCYHQVVIDFCEHFSISPKLLEAEFKQVENIDFSSKEGLENLSQEVSHMLAKFPASKKIFIKADQGTYGMGIMVVSSAEEVQSLNRKQRNKMDIGKNKKKFTSVLLQEGVETILKWDDQPAEVTIYLVGGQSVGGFMRTNSLKDANSNLNARGMVFQKFCLSEIRQNEDHKHKEAVYSVISRLSATAGGIEIKRARERGQ